MSEPAKLVTLESIDQTLTIHCGLNSKYASQWTPVAAFRELVQNWRDGIIEAFDISEDDFQVTRYENDREIIYKATEQGRDKCLGHIRWSLINRVGTVDILNQGSTLQPWHLDMGGTSKQDDDVAAGAHGEGLKVALLVLMRQPQDHAIRCFSGGFWWTFYFDENQKLVARITRRVPSRYMYDVYTWADRETFNHSFLSPYARVTNQNFVRIFIDDKGFDDKGRDENVPKAQSGVTREEFQEWTRAALFLQKIDDGMVVTTPRGDLIIDPRFGGHVYLKGLLLKESTAGRSASITGKQLQYGYNFATGVTNRERQSMAAADDETRAIFSIWSYAVDEDSDLIGSLHDLLNSRDPEYADVAKPEKFIKKNLARSLRDNLLTQFEGRWFYTASEKSSNLRFDNVVQGLGLEPFELKESYWNVLRRAGFRTAEEEEQRQFLAAPTTNVPDDTFAQHIHHLLRAGLQSCPQTVGITVQFVKGGSLGLDSFYSASQGRLKVHEKWLTEAGAAEELGLPENILMYSLLFNAARRLLADTIQQVPLWEFPAGTGNRTRYWSQKRAISKVDQRILEYTQIKKDLQFTSRRMTSTSTKTYAVQWNPTTGWVPKTKIYVHFHSQATCSHLKEILIAGNFPLYCGRNGCRTIETAFRYGESTHIKTWTGDYFVALSNQLDGNSFVVFSDEPLILEAKVNESAGVKRPRDESKIFTLEDGMPTPDFGIPRNWYHGSNSVGTQAVIGIKIEDDPATSASKRQRTGECSML